MTRSQILTDLKNLIGPGIETGDSGLNTWINDGYMQMVSEIKKVNPDFFVKSATTSTVTNQQEYTLPTDFESMIMANEQILGVWKRLLPMGNADIRNIPQISDTTSNQGFSDSEPKYYLYKNVIGLMPIPTASVTSGLKVWYSYTPSEMDDDSDEPDIPEKYHYIIKYDAYANYLDQDDEHAAAERMRIRFDQLVNRMIEDMSEKQQDEVKSVEISQNQDLYVDPNNYF